MNIKKIFMIACCTLQFSALLQADQAAWKNAFLLFSNGAKTVNDAIAYVKENRGRMAYNKAQDILGTGANNTPEGQAVGLYMSSGSPTVLATKFKNEASRADLEAALIADYSTIATTATPATTPVVTPTAAATTPVASQPVTTVVTQNPTDAAAAQLKSQIEAAKQIYNQYKPGTYTVTA